MSTKGPRLERILQYMPSAEGLCIIHDIPISYSDEEAVAHETINAMIKDFSVPGVDIKYQNEDHFTAMIEIPMQVENDLGGGMEFEITMFVDDRMDNWYSLYRYARTLINPRDGFPQDDTTQLPYHPTRRAAVYAQRRMGVNLIEIRVGDGSDELFNVFHFKRCMLKSISGFKFAFGTDNYITFNTRWKCANFTLERVKQDLDKPIPIND